MLIIWGNKLAMSEHLLVLTSSICPSKRYNITSVNSEVPKFDFGALEKVVSIWLVKIDLLTVLEVVTVGHLRLPCFCVLTLHLSVD